MRGDTFIIFKFDIQISNLRCGKFFLPRFIIIMEYKSNFLLNESIQNMGLEKIKPHVIMVQVLYIKHVSFCAYSNRKQKSMQVICLVHPVFFLYRLGKI